MAAPRAHDPVLLVVAAFSRHTEAIEWAKVRLISAYGPVALASATFAFHQTTYYEATMGTDLKKQFFAFGNLVAADCLADIKLYTNALEQELAESSRYSETRPLNLDPGILSLGKFQLATTKDQAHRIYLRDGIFAEVTLRFEAKTYEPWPWTYADYREPEVRQTLKEFRTYYKKRLQGSSDY